MSAVTQGPSAAGASILWRLALAVALATLVAALWRTSWLCDDAFITFRSVENLVAGHGPVWNVGERVQTYTHPAWFWLVAAVRFVTGECRDSVMVLGMLLSTGALVWLLVLGRSVPLAIAAVVTVLASRAWLVFATAGVETSLIYLLTAALLAASLRPAGERRLTAVAFVAGLLCCTRYDLVLFAGPLLLSSCRQVPWRRAAALVALAFVPLWCWLGFAAVYYGSIYPVTAYAKLFCHGLPAADVWMQGLRYLLDCLTVDPVTIVFVLFAGAFALRRGSPRRSLAIGMLLYAVYVLKVGGDYMSGRFWAPVVGMALAVVVDQARDQARDQTRGRGGRWCAVGALLAIGLAFVPGTPWWLRPVPAERPAYEFSQAGILNEEIVGRSDHGLASSIRVPDQPGWLTAEVQRGGFDRRVWCMGNAVGFVGYAYGPLFHIIDPWLCDPLLMRLPVADPGYWRIGHFYRRFPRGYLESLVSGDNRIPHAGLAALHDAVRSATRDPIWSGQRWGHLWSLWTGQLDAGVADFVATEYRKPPRTEVAYAAISADVAETVPWFEVAQGRTAQAGGLTIALPAPTDSPAVVLSVSADATYRLTFRRGGESVGTAEFKSAQTPLLGLGRGRIEVPAAARPFDALWIDVEPVLTQPAAAFVCSVQLAN